jgi:hypothetical protein
MQAFAYRHLVPAKELKLVVNTGSAPARPSEKKVADTKPAKTAGPSVKIPTGGSAKVQVKLTNTTYMGKLQLELDEPPEGISIKSFVPTREGAELVLQADAAKNKPGQKGSLTVTAYAERMKTKLQPEKKRTSLGAVPAIAFEIVAK